MSATATLDRHGHASSRQPNEAEPQRRQGPVDYWKVAGVAVGADDAIIRASLSNRIERQDRLRKTIKGVSTEKLRDLYEAQTMFEARHDLIQRSRAASDMEILGLSSEPTAGDAAQIKRNFLQKRIQELQELDVTRGRDPGLNQVRNRLEAISRNLTPAVPASAAPASLRSSTLSTPPRPTQPRLEMTIPTLPNRRPVRTNTQSRSRLGRNLDGLKHSGEKIGLSASVVALGAVAGWAVHSVIQNLNPMRFVLRLLHRGPAVAGADALNPLIGYGVAGISAAGAMHLAGEAIKSVYVKKYSVDALVTLAQSAVEFDSARRELRKIILFVAKLADLEKEVNEVLKLTSEMFPKGGTSRDLNSQEENQARLSEVAGGQRKWSLMVETPFDKDVHVEGAPGGPLPPRYSNYWIQKITSYIPIRFLADLGTKPNKNITRLLSLMLKSEFQLGFNAYHNMNLPHDQRVGRIRQEIGGLAQTLLQDKGEFVVDGLNDYAFRNLRAVKYLTAIGSVGAVIGGIASKIAEGATGAPGTGAKSLIALVNSSDIQQALHQPMHAATDAFSTINNWVSKGEIFHSNNWWVK